MPDPGPGLSRPCPSCGRRVPRSVAVCRCGAEVPGQAADATETPGPEAGGLSAASLAVGLVLLIAVVGTGYWSFNRPPATVLVDRPARGAVEDGSPLPPLSGTVTVTAADDLPTAAPATAGTSAPGSGTGLPAEVPPAASAPLEDVVSRIMPAVVVVETSAGRGSGFYVRPDTLITNAHVVKNEAFVTLRHTDGTAITARVDLKSPAHDIAILRVTTPTANQAVIPMGTADTLRPGQEVIAIGSPFGTLQNSVTRGIVSGLRRSGVATMIQNDATAHPGNSGGPLLDRRGVAIGVTTGGDHDKPGINYAVAIDHARDILDGRLADSTAPPLALKDVKAVEPLQPEADDEGQRALVGAVAKVAATADAIDTEWKKFRQACYTSSLPASFSREWFVMLSPRPITPSQVRGGACATFVAGVQADANGVHAAMRSALDNARRAGVLPGVIRDALQSNRLEFDGWDR